MPFQKSSKPNLIYFQKRRGISQVIGSLLLLAIVVPLGSVILFSGTYEIQAFNNEMTNSMEYTNKRIQEDLIFEHTRFNPTDEAVMISIRNTGSVETTIDRITIVNMSDTKLLFKISGIGTFSPTTIPLKESKEINFIATLNPSHPSWDHQDLDDDPNHEYKISVITERGNFFDTIVRKYNT